MRAIYFNEIIDGKKLTITGAEASHLIKSVRIKLGEKVLILNGNGLKIFSKVCLINKRDLVLEIYKKDKEADTRFIDLFIASPKKEYFEDILRSSIECNVKKIIPVESSFSQYTYTPSERISRLMQTALVQSNSSYMPEISAIKKISELVEVSKNYDFILCLNSQIEKPETKLTIPSNARVLLVIGPEGGFSQDELIVFGRCGNLKEVLFQTNILKSKTAVPFGVGFIHAARIN